MAQANMGFGQTFKLGQAYSPTLANADYTRGMVSLQPTAAGMTAPTMLQSASPSLLDVGVAQPQAPGSLLGFGNNVDAMMGAQGGGVNWGGVAQQAVGLLGGAGGGRQPDQPQGPVAPDAPVIRAPQNDKLARLLAQYGITGV